MVIPLFDNEFLPFLKNQISVSHKRIYAIIYFAIMFQTRKNDDVSEIVSALIQAKKRGLDVRILMNSIIKRGLTSKHNFDVAKKLYDNNITVSMSDFNRTTHAKVWIFDDDGIIIGSHNLTKSSFHKNREVSIYFIDFEANKKISSYIEQEINKFGTKWLR